jgi:hypothetical protein
MEMHNSFFVLFVTALKKFSRKKNAIMTKESRKIRENYKNYALSIITDDRNAIFD